MKRVFPAFLAVVILVLAASWGMSSLWGAKTVRVTLPQQIVFTPGETLGAFATRNAIPSAVVREAFGEAASHLEAPRTSLGLAEPELESRLRKAAALADEHAEKNWQKILPKFVLWALWLAFMGWTATRGRLDRQHRKAYYLVAIVLFGVVFGSDPSPMGTVKDAIALLAREGVVFPPRLIALAVFLLSVVIAHKAICSWGCQLGVLQDFIFRLNRNAQDTAGILRQYKVPFAVSNSLRIAFLAIFILVAVMTGTDLIEPIDPFKVFNPAHLGWIGAGFLALLLVASLFIYRPWCHFFCPFGLVSWLVERFSIHRVRVDAQACTACGACARACPSHAMAGILDKRAFPPDCFSCGVCVETCPTQAIRFGSRNRQPQGTGIQKGPVQDDSGREA